MPMPLSSFKKISTHDLVRGRHDFTCPGLQQHQISTHDLVRGRPAVFARLIFRNYFNSRPRERPTWQAMLKGRGSFISTHDLVRGRHQSCNGKRQGNHFNSRPRERPTAIFTQKLILLKSFLKLIAQIISIFHLYKYFLNHFS